MGKLDTLLWYLKRPNLYPDMVRSVRSSLTGRRRQASTRAESEAWCAQRAVDTQDALERLTGRRGEPPVEERHARTFERAREVAAACPVEMGGPGNLDLIYGCAEHLEAERAIETGVAYGWSSLAILLAMRSRPRARLVSNDMPYRNRDNDDYVGCVVPPSLRPRWQLLRYADRQGLPRALRMLGEIDLCHYDSDKKYEGRMWAYPLLWAALRPGGIFLSDDIGDNVAFRDFASMQGIEPVVVGYRGKYIGAMAKPSATPAV